MEGTFCFTSTEARLLIREGDRGWGGGLGRGRKNESSTADTARKRPERPWTAARTMEMLRQYPFAIAQRLDHYAIAFSTAVLGRITRTMPFALLLRKTRSERSPTFVAQLHLPAQDLFWANLRVQLYLPPLELAWNPDAICQVGFVTY